MLLFKCFVIAHRTSGSMAVRSKIQCGLTDNRAKIHRQQGLNLIFCGCQGYRFGTSGCSSRANIGAGTSFGYCCCLRWIRRPCYLSVQGGSTFVTVITTFEYLFYRCHPFCHQAPNNTTLLSPPRTSLKSSRCWRPARMISGLQLLPVTLDFGAPVPVTPRVVSPAKNRSTPRLNSLARRDLLAAWRELFPLPSRCAHTNL